MKLTHHRKAVSITERRLRSEREQIHTGGAHLVLALTARISLLLATLACLILFSILSPMYNRYIMVAPPRRSYKVNICFFLLVCVRMLRLAFSRKHILKMPFFDINNFTQNKSSKMTKSEDVTFDTTIKNRSTC